MFIHIQGYYKLFSFIPVLFVFFKTIKQF